MHVLKNIAKKYGEKVVFDNLNLSFETDKVTAIMGGSGIGKSTLINIISGLTDFEGELIGFDEKISYVFQSNRLIPFLSVIKNVEYAISSVYKEKNQRKSVALDYLKHCEIDHLANKKVCDISGGEKQRVQLARAFAYPSKIMLMDEPFSSVDLALKMRLIDLCVNLLSKFPRTVIFVSHDVDEVLSLAHNVVVLKNCSEFESFQIDNQNTKRDLTSAQINEVRKNLYNAIIN